MKSTRQDSPINRSSDIEDEHFRISDSIIEWMEYCKSLRDKNPESSLTTILSPPAQPLLNDYHLSAPGVAWNLVKIFRTKKINHLVDIRMQLYYLKIYISACAQCEQLNEEYSNLTDQHLLQGDVHAYTLNSLVDIQNGKSYEYLNDLVNRSITHISNCDRCRAKGHYCQLCGPSGLMSSMILNNTIIAGSSTSTGISSGGGSCNGPGSLGSGSNSHSGHSNTTNSQNTSSQIVSGNSVPTGDGGAGRSNGAASHTTSQNMPNSTKTNNQQLQQQSAAHQLPLSHSEACASSSSLSSLRSAYDDHELIFPFEVGRVAQCHACGCCFHLQCYIDAGQNCPKCERIQRRRAEQSGSILSTIGGGGGGGGGQSNGADKHNQVVALNPGEEEEGGQQATDGAPGVAVIAVAPSVALESRTSG